MKRFYDYGDIPYHIRITSMNKPVKKTTNNPNGRPKGSENKDNEKK